MRLLTCDVDVRSHVDPVWLVPISDTHVGSSVVDHNALRRWMALIGKGSEKGHRVVSWLQGDTCDLIARRDPRYRACDIHEMFRNVGDNLIAAETDAAVDMIKGLGDTLAFVIEGNHEAHIAKQGDVDPYDMLCTALGASDDKVWTCGVPPLRVGTVGLVRLRFIRGLSKVVCSLWVHHGYFGGTRPSKVRHLERIVRLWGVDLAVVGHGHQSVDTGPVCIPRPNNDWTRIRSRAGRGIMCPGWKAPFQSDHTSWEEGRGFPPEIAGPTLIKYIPSTREVQVFFCGSAWEEASRVFG